MGQLGHRGYSPNKSALQPALQHEGLFPIQNAYLFLVFILVALRDLVVCRNVQLFSTSPDLTDLVAVSSTSHVSFFHIRFYLVKSLFLSLYVHA